MGVESGMVPKSTPTHSHLKVGVKMPIPMGENYCTPTPILKVVVQHGSSGQHILPLLGGPGRAPDGSVRLDERGEGSEDYRTAGRSLIECQCMPRVRS